MSFKGQITAILRNAETFEIENSQEVNNIITESFFDRVIATGQIGNLQLTINGMKMASNRWTASNPPNGSGNFTARPDGSIPAQANLQLFAKTETTPAFIQFSGRFNPPSVSRTIRSVLLLQSKIENSSGFDYTYMWTPDDIRVEAYSSLNADCVQSNSQVLDIYYRIFFPTEIGTEVETKFMINLLVSISVGMTTHSVYPTPLVMNAKTGDEDKRLFSNIAHRWNSADSLELNTAYRKNGNSQGHLTLDWNSDFSDCQGVIFNGLITGGRYSAYERISGEMDAHVNNASNYYPYCPIAISANNLISTKKVQNLIGHGTTAKPATTTPWLDVDNLPNGSGRITLAETWNNRFEPTAPGLYYKVLLPRWNTITISTSGGVGSAGSYKYKTNVFLGHSKLQIHPSYGNVGLRTANGYTLHALPSVCGSAHAINPPAGAWGLIDSDAGKTLIENIETTYLDAEQISASIKYDETSIILVKKNFILLYSIGAGDYWKFKGPFTNIHQVAVVNDDIYIACSDTGLYKVSPKQSLTVTSLSAPTAGVDLSKCFGVAKGYGDSLWTVGNNGLFSLTAGTWSKYDETTTPAFSLPGVSNDKWSNIAYLKVDEYSSTYEMHLVRKFNATVDATSFGVWWSTATPAVNSFNDVLAYTTGRPRTNRTHFAGQEGLWAIVNDGKHKVMAFNSNVPVPVINGASITTHKLSDIYSSIFFVHNRAGQIRLMTMHENVFIDGGGNWTYAGRRLCIVDSSGIIEESGEPALYYTCSNSVVYDKSGIGTRGSQTRPGSSANYGYHDSAATFILDKGVMVSLWCGTEYGTSYINGGTATMDNLIVGVSNYGTGLTLDGGPLGYLAERSYGWNGSNWIEDLTTPKDMHTGFQNLLEGVQVKFENATVGNSFVASNYYRFGLCEGILKDNATRHHMGVEYYSRRKVKKSTELSAYTVPVLTALPTGSVGLDTSRSTAGAYMNEQGCVVFPDPAGVQLGYGNKQVTGNFTVTYNAQYLRSIVEARTWCSFGISRMAEGDNVIGFHMSAGSLFCFDGSTYILLSSNMSAVSTLTIARENDTIKFYMNDVLQRTSVAAATKIRTADLRLELTSLAICGTNIALLIPNRQCPPTTIVVNDSDRAVFLGNAVAKTGYYGDRFSGIDAITVNNSVKLDGVSAILKYDGTLPLAGEVTIDAVSGILYFNAADEGKTIACSIDYFKSE